MAESVLVLSVQWPGSNTPVFLWLLPQRGLVGPPGPPGPQGPPGAPGAEVTREVLLQEFKEILKGKDCVSCLCELPLLVSPMASKELALKAFPYLEVKNVTKCFPIAAQFKLKS